MLRSIRCVEIEIHSYCNRKCQWCPNSKLRRDQIKIMPEDLYLKIMNELKEKGFNGVISYSRYNEPMADIKLLKKRVEQAKNILPGVKLVSNTNGDYLDCLSLDRLLLDDLTVMDYDCMGLEQCLEKLKRVGARVALVDYPFIYALYKNINILYYVDWPKNVEIVDRGGFLKKPVKLDGKKMNWLKNKERRSNPCFEPYNFIGIDYTGRVTPCCQIRSDFSKHNKYILGDLNHQSLSGIMLDKKAVNFRDLMSSYNASRYPDPCKYCQKSAGRYTRENCGIEYNID